MRIKGSISFNHQATNDTEKYVLLGNCTDFISWHDTQEEASKALDNINVGESTWTVVYILKPYETRGINRLSQSIYDDRNASQEDYSLDRLRNKK